MQLLTASSKRWESPRILLARPLPAQPNIPKGTAMVTLRAVLEHLPFSEYARGDHCRIVTERDGNARSPSSLSMLLCLVKGFVWHFLVSFLGPEEDGGRDGLLGCGQDKEGPLG